MKDAEATKNPPDLTRVTWISRLTLTGFLLLYPVI
jgi:hypothetical protein